MTLDPLGLDPHTRGLLDAMRAWADDTFPVSTPNDIMEHLAEEIGEVREALAATGFADHLQHFERPDPGLLTPDHPLCEEVADAAILLLHLCNRLDLPLAAAIARKHAINLTRTWGQRTATGGQRHDPAEGDRDVTWYYSLTTEPPAPDDVPLGPADLTALQGFIAADDPRSSVAPDADPATFTGVGEGMARLLANTPADTTPRRVVMPSRVAGNVPSEPQDV
jgi:NTP pyrophosphatase (non-canonical NTP hydrolase)